MSDAFTPCQKLVEENDHRDDQNNVYQAAKVREKKPDDPQSDQYSADDIKQIAHVFVLSPVVYCDRLSRRAVPLTCSTPFCMVIVSKAMGT